MGYGIWETRDDSSEMKAGRWDSHRVCWEPYQITLIYGRWEKNKDDCYQDQIHAIDRKPRLRKKGAVMVEKQMARLPRRQTLRGRREREGIDVGCGGLRVRE